MAEVPDPDQFSSPSMLDTVPGTAPVGVFNIIARTGLFTFVLLLAVSFADIVHAKDAAEAEHTEKLELLRERISDLKNDLLSMRGERDVMQDALEESEKEIGVVSATLHGLEKQAEDAGKRMQGLQRDFDVEQKSLEKTRLSLKKELQIAYMTGNQEQIKLLLNQEEPAALGRLMVYHEYFTRARTQALENIRVSMERLIGLEHKLEIQRSEIRGLIERKQEKSSLLTAQQGQRRAILAQLQDRLSSKTDQLAVLEAGEHRLQKLVESLQQAIRDIPPSKGENLPMASLKGKLHWPVAGQISMRYGEKHASGKLRSRGVHIASPAGADVRSIARGRVIFADWLRGFGLLLIIDHGDNYMSLYGKNSSLYRGVGERVARDEVVAATGSSGGQAQAGLYLELRKNGKPFNPGSWFDGKPGALKAAGNG